jgi:hypothetical protein
MKSQIIIFLIITNITYISKNTIIDNIDLRGKSAMFIGDSYTANYNWGWQTVLGKKTGIKVYNFSKVGKQTSWMFATSKQQINSTYSYCFIYGGMNDIYGNKKPHQIVENIQKIIDLCILNKVHPIVITGFNAEECIIPLKNKEIYPKLYTQYQDILLKNIKRAQIINIKKIINRKDCADSLCHLNKIGHIKIANAVIQQMKIKTF